MKFKDKKSIQKIRRTFKKDRGSVFGAAVLSFALFSENYDLLSPEIKSAVI